MEFVKTVEKMRLEKTAQALRANNMDAFVVDSRDEVKKIVEDLLFDGAVIANGGTVTATECGLFELFENGRYEFLDRTKAQDVTEIYRKSFFADFYFTSANAITENGELYNVDGNSNRVAAIAYGPKNVIVVAGVNKIVKNLDDAQKRVKMIASPANTIRLGIESYCAKTGECVALKNGGDCEMTQGCNADTRICCNYLISARQRIKGRIKVILVNESLGF